MRLKLSMMTPVNISSIKKLHTILMATKKRPASGLLFRWLGKSGPTKSIVPYIMADSNGPCEKRKIAAEEIKVSVMVMV